MNDLEEIVNIQQHPINNEEYINKCKKHEINGSISNSFMQDINKSEFVFLTGPFYKKIFKIISRKNNDGRERKTGGRKVSTINFASKIVFFCYVASPCPRRLSRK